MKKIYNKIVKVFAVAVALTGATLISSCSDFLEEYSQDLAKIRSWEDLDEVLLGDGYLPSSRLIPENGYTTVDDGDNLDILHLMSDEIEENEEYSVYDYGDYRTGLFGFATWQQDTGTDEKFKYAGGDEKYWDFLYKRINVCNMVISLIDEQPEHEPEDAVQKSRVKGEAYFLRGAYYFILANLYAQPYNPATASSVPGVPVKTSEFVEDIEYSRGTLDQVYAQIISDFKNAEQALDGIARKSIYRADVTAARLMLARTYLYMQNWPLAIQYANAVLGTQNALLDLHARQSGVDCLYAASPETIFSMGGYMISTVFADLKGKWGDTYPSYVLSDDMLDLYPSDDLRSKLYIGKSQDLGLPNTFIKVSGQRNSWGSYSEVSSCFLLRTPEAYLILAEASAFNNDEGTARQTLESFLATRMNSQVSVNESGNDLIDLIRDERAREFLLEGHRWFDLRRYTVCEPYKWSKPIIHKHCYFSDYDIDYVDIYRLEPYDLAYTLPIPRTVREFQNSIGNNNRPARTPYKGE